MPHSNDIVCTLHARKDRSLLSINAIHFSGYIVRKPVSQIHPERLAYGI